MPGLFSRLSALLFAAVVLIAGEAARGETTPTPEQDDAALRALSFLGPRTGFVVGDHGVIWKTADAGESWSLIPCPVSTHWRSVCFVTDRLGWIAGGRTAPYTHQSLGTILQTRDGGQTWETLVHETWPRFHHVQFFDLDEGVAVCDASPRCPSGVLRTTDGGKNWQPLAGDSRSGWRVAAFAGPDHGLFAGLRGEQGWLSESTVQSIALNQFGLRGLYGLSVTSDGRGWLVGDGATIQQTENLGAGWHPPAQTLPRSLRDCLNFRTVAHRGDRVWATGAPGSVVLHSADFGRTWTSQTTSQPTPLLAIQFVSDHHGFAVGELGRIAATTDGGATWKDLRGADRRLAMLNIESDPSHASLTLTLRTAGEQGYRTGAYALTRQDLGENRAPDSQSDLRLHDAMAAARGASSEVGWRFPVAVPGLEAKRDRLIQEWSILTEQRLGDVMLNELVSLLRTWRPDVVVLDAPVEGDSPSELLSEAIKRAVVMAGDPARYPDQQEHLNLSAWRVSKLFARRPAEKGALLVLDPHEILPRLGTTIQSGSAVSLAILLDKPAASEREGFTLLYSRQELGDQENVGRSFFTGLSIPPGGPARRELPSIKEVRFDELDRVAQKQRVMDGVTRQMLRDPRLAHGTLAQLNDVLGGLPPADAALQLAGLARQYRDQGQWPLAEQTYTVLVDLYADQPVAHEGSRWLLSYWASEEVAWQRMRTSQSTRSDFTIDDGQLRENLTQSRNFLAQRRTPEELEAFLSRQKSPTRIQPVKVEVTQGDLRSVVTAAGSNGEQMQGAYQPVSALQQKMWSHQATRMEAFLSKASPAFLEEPATQFSLAAHWRRAMQHSKADMVYDKFLKQSSRDPWHRTALGEVWLASPNALSPKPVAACRRTTQPPVLDGRLEDDCWSVSRPIPLLSSSEAAMSDSYVGSHNAPTIRPGGIKTAAPSSANSAWISYDDKYVYLAARLQRVAELPADLPVHAGRTFDEDLSPFDRVAFLLDIDRDYDTAYRFEIDQRGHTRDACWEHQGWNPKWHVACHGDDNEWSFEAAIPLDQLMPEAPTPGATWSVGVVRIMPAVGLQSWTHPAAERPRMETLGLLRFE
jgi:photosystem II stability/assembly factor-like uncharacterized protein